MRFMCVAAAAAVPIAMLIGTSSAHADTGVDGYVQCLGGDAKPPPPGVRAENWFPSLHVIDTDIGSGIPSAEVVRRLVDMGVSPNDAETRVRCYLANLPH
ncbi:hypothetical protein A5753_19030 [Mycobacterium sp. 852002-51971_SCH5477799-a]|uniref:hypothetical protein n=1 Tax=Mycobacterium sp. 852002-51971_SCH5477799-a TaxID=1834106 RepID=UPI0007FCD247|nr:hypothetical protein [Mycobacterium sp. 852002-51971_SCH5477799-a]OBF61325.1 hypothetical protein A5753_19030 [Mycobacterium sp. 852002-51971_SCH5477799-a]